MKAVYHLELTSKILLCQMVKHPGIYKTLHEGAPILWQTKAWQPLIANPFVVHLTKCQTLQIPTVITLTRNAI